MDTIKDLKITPTSEILLSDYCGKISLRDKSVSQVFTKRLENKYKLDCDTIDKIINHDFDVFSKRGINVRDYAFCQENGLYARLDILYDYIQPQENENWFIVVNRFSDLSFSELAMSYGLFSTLESFHRINSSKLKKERKKRIVDYEELNRERDLKEYYQFLKLASRSRILQNIEARSSISNPSFKDFIRMLRVTMQEISNTTLATSAMSQEWHEFKNDSYGYEKEIQLIKKHPNIEQIYRNRRI